jgi:hypothetical protein
VATGIAPVGDAWACSNPSLGRGMALGLLHVQRLRDVIREQPEDPRQFAEVWNAVTEAELTPWYRETVEEDRARIAQIEALRNGNEPELQSGSSAALLAALRAALPHDPDAFRAYSASLLLLDPPARDVCEPGFRRADSRTRPRKRPPTPGGSKPHSAAKAPR